MKSRVSHYCIILILIAIPILGGCPVIYQYQCGEYELGETWMDECNTCECTTEGVSCTIMECGCGEKNLGESWDVGCNKCECTSSGIECTELACSSCEDHEVGETWHDGCTICECTEEGSICKESEECMCDDHEWGEMWFEGCKICKCKENGIVECDTDNCNCGDHDIGEAWFDDESCQSCICDEKGETICTSNETYDCYFDKCEDLSNDIAEAISENQICDTDFDCTIIKTQCINTSGKCYVSVNEQNSYINISLNEYNEFGCPDETCNCSGPIPSAVCNEGICDTGRTCGHYGTGEEWINDYGCKCHCYADGTIDCEGCNPVSCGDHIAGERWVDDDGCNTCLCDESGRIECTTMNCANIICEEISDKYSQTVENAKECTSNNQCQKLNGSCAVSYGRCHEAVNLSLSQRDLDCIMENYENNSCVEMDCDCIDQGDVACISGICKFIGNSNLECGSHNIGDTWNEACNTCLCTENGQVCTEMECID